MMDYEARKKLLESKLKPSRYKHSLGVAETAAAIAARLGMDAEQARLAGLLHDCAREYKNEELIAEAERRGISFGPVEKNMPLLLHAPVGACRVREIYEVTDEAIAQAIARHTVGGPAMTALDKLIYFADMIEPLRDYPGVEELRRASRECSLDEMFLLGLDQSLQFVLQKGGLVHPDTVLARNELLLAKISKV